MTITLIFNSIQKDNKINVYLANICLLEYDIISKQSISSKLNIDEIVYNIAQKISSKTFKEYNIVLSKEALLLDVITEIENENSYKGFTNEYYTVWIDMESKIRTDDILDLDICEQILKTHKEVGKYYDFLRYEKH